MSYTDTITRDGVTARREWSADPATDLTAYLTDQRCVRCDAQVTDDDRGPLYDSVTDDGTAHECRFGAEADVRAFAKVFPTAQVLRAVALCEEGRLTWQQVHDLFRTATAKALAEVWSA